LIALATLLLGAVLFTLYLRAYKADRRDDAKGVYRWLGFTAPPWFLVTLINAVQADVLFVVINIAMTMSGVWAWAEYRICVDADKAAAVAEPPVEVLDSHSGGEA
jgi:hypothetical protein